VEGKLAISHPAVAAFREEHLYARAIPAKYRRGSVLFYRLDTWHRGTPVIEGKRRRVHNLLFKKAGCDWITMWNAGAARHMYTLSQTLERLVANRPERTVLGYPPPGSAFWDDPRMQGYVEERYRAVEGFARPDP
jgi:hypothetical protein